MIAANATPGDLGQHAARLHAGLAGGYSMLLREPGGSLPYPFIVPGGVYEDLWDWDSWLTNVAIRQILRDKGDPTEAERVRAYEEGCILNFLSFARDGGWIPICVGPRPPKHPVMAEFQRPADIHAQNMHKPCLAQHAALLTREHGGDAEWLRAAFPYLQAFLNNYHGHHRHAATGLYYWQTDLGIGVDNDPCTFSRPPGSSGSIYLNCLMYRELGAMVYLCERLGCNDLASDFRARADELRAAIQIHCWDERDGFFYSVDLNLHSNQGTTGLLHSTKPAHWHCLIQRLGVWSGFLALWAEIATPAQAERVVREHARNEATFLSAAGIRSLSRLEKMYLVAATGNPSCWLGPVWIVANYFTFRGLVKYGYAAEAHDLAERTVHLLGRDLARCGQMHEYYHPDSGEPIINRGFQSWNLLVLNLIAWLEKRKVVWEF